MTGRFSAVLTIGIFFLAGCSNTRHLPPNEKLYIGPTVTVKGPSLSVRERKTLRSDLEGLARPKPNTTFLGMRIKLSIYNLFRNKKPKSFFGRIRDKMGEPPVLLSQVDVKKNAEILQNHLENKGWFHAKVTGDTSVRRKKARAKYKAETGEQYSIRTVYWPTDSSDLSKNIVATTNNTLLKKDAPFDIDVIKAERTRVDAYLKQNGFYYFSPEYLLVRTDSTVGSNKVDMYVVVKPGAPLNVRKIYRINDVFVYADYSLNTGRLDTLKSDAQFYKGYYIIDRDKHFKPYLFEEAMQFKPGEVYNRVDHNQTLNRLINLNVFKFVKNRFQPVGDSAKLDAFYYLTPMATQSVRAEVATITRSNNLNGSQITLNWTNRNVFRSATQFNFKAYVGSDVQFSGALRGYNTYRTGAELDYVIPRFVVPFMNLRNKGAYAPRTFIRIGYDILDRKRLYALNSYRFEYGYAWKKSIRRQHELYPISISYVQPLNVTPAYDTLKLNDPALQHAIEQQFILGGRYEFIYNQLANDVQPLNAYYFDGVVDLSGNIAGLLSGANVKKGDTVKIRKVPFAQYVKIEGDLRYYRKLGLKSTWANRIDIGIGYPYGNSTEIPYIKQFFAGGNNSLRGFRSRSVGPGTYHPVLGRFIPDQTGDLKLEINSEFRPHLSGPIYGALFIDAGNIWLVNDSTRTHKPGSQFTSKFLNELAVDVGVGVRMDITIFVIRFDVAFPIRKPWEQNPWVMNQIRFSNPSWRRENIVFNLAIGYPF
jgi:outer membrane protein insertion porin family